MFPKVRKAVGGKGLQELGERMAEVKKRAPTRPHPRSPDQPPGNLLAAPLASIMDAGKSLARGVRRGICSKMP